MSDDRPFRVKKVSPYPFIAQLHMATKVVNLSVARINSRGILAYTQDFLKVGASGDLTFDIPVLNYPVKIHSRTIKFYQQFTQKMPKMSAPALPAPVKSGEEKDANPPASSAAQRLVELHFLNLSEKDLDHIKGFLKAIKQRDN